MTATLEVIRRPSPDLDPHIETRHRSIGLALAAVGLMMATVVLVAGVVFGNLVDDVGSGDTVVRGVPWAFGLATLAFATIKLGIATTLVGIIHRLWIRVDSVKAALGRLAPTRRVNVVEGPIQTDFGAAEVTSAPADPLLIHRAAKVLWAPMLTMGAMAVGAGFVLSLFQSGEAVGDPATARDLGAWVQGLQFLGEGLLLAGISFLLGTILAALRQGGGEVQAMVGGGVQTLRMPLTAKLFVGLMAAGMMVSMAQFVLYLVVATVDEGASFAAWSAWLGPFRELGLGLLLSGIVLALVTIGTVLGFQFHRIRQLLAGQA